MKMAGSGVYLSSLDDGGGGELQTKLGGKRVLFYSKRKQYQEQRVHRPDGAPSPSALVYLCDTAIITTPFFFFNTQNNIQGRT